MIFSHKLNDVNLRGYFNIHIMLPRRSPLTSLFVFAFSLVVFLVFAFAFVFVVFLFSTSFSLRHEDSSRGTLTLVWQGGWGQEGRSPLTSLFVGDL